jgi:hypothetical protein
MNKLIVVCGLALTLAGCNATVYPSRPMLIDLETRPPLVVPQYYSPLPHPRPYMHPRHRCHTIWDNTYRGYRERMVCR